MTTIIADAKLGLMVSDSNVTDDDRQWSGRKVWRIKGALVATAGDAEEGRKFLAWYRAGGTGKTGWKGMYALILTPGKLLYVGDECTLPETIRSGREAIGTGAKAAMCAYEALGWQDPKRAVQIVCRHDAGSRTPVRVYRL